MKNIIVLGSGRSGTSLVTGIITRSTSKYFLGPELIAENYRNPKGNFESNVINHINEDILELIQKRHRPNNIFGRLFFSSVPATPQRWLSRIPVSTELIEKESITTKIKELGKNVPFCYKDPRFSYTFPYWEKYLPNFCVICVFRDPAKTISSIKKELNYAPHLKGLSLSNKQLFSVWELMYRNILDHFNKSEKDWFFIEYDQMFDEIYLNKMGTFLDIELNINFADKKFDRSSSSLNVPSNCVSLFNKLRHMTN